MERELFTDDGHSQVRNVQKYFTILNKALLLLVKAVLGSKPSVVK